MNKIFNFGEKVDDFDVKVLNEREVRASAGILFFFAIISFMLALLNGNFYMTKIFVIIFLVDFSIRIFINPRFSPSLILGRFFVKNQRPEYVGAPQKKFAWGIGFFLALIIFTTIVVLNTFSPLNALVCILCLLLLFFESAFGICLGCKVYNLFNKEKAKLCPGGTCEVIKKEEIQKINIYQVGILILFFMVIFGIIFSGVIEKGGDLRKGYQKNNLTGVEKKVSENIDKDCEVPDWAIKIGHGEVWKEHHECK